MSTAQGKHYYTYVIISLLDNGLTSLKVVCNLAWKLRYPILKDTGSVQNYKNLILSLQDWGVE